MNTAKNQAMNVKEGNQKANGTNILKTGSSSLLMMIAIFLTIPVLAQAEKDTTISVYSTNDDTYAQMLDYSRPELQQFEKSVDRQFYKIINIQYENESKYSINPTDYAVLYYRFNFCAKRSGHYQPTI